MTARTKLQNLPPHILTKINKQTLNEIPFLYKLESNGEVSKVKKNHNFTKNTEYGKYVLPLSSIIEVHPNIRSKIEYTRRLSYRKSSPKRLPYTHYATQKGRRYHIPYSKHESNPIIWLPKSEYTPVRYNYKSGLYNKVVNYSPENKNTNVKFISRKELKKIPTSFK